MSQIKLELSEGRLELGGGAASVVRRLADFAGAGGATYFVPRWIFLRMLGVISFLFFVNLMIEGKAIMGLRGLDPLAGYLDSIEHGRLFSAWFGLPSLFWLWRGDGMIDVLSLAGAASSLLLIFNRWPRAAAIACFFAALSFVGVFRTWGGYQHDGLLLESLFLSMFVTPPGGRPGLAKDDVPRPLVVFALRWLFFRLAFESGVGKFTSGESHWRDFTAMDIHYETSPLPTVFGYYLGHFPHWFHVLEIFVMMAAELVAPWIALFGRRFRLAAFVIWTFFQLGIELTGNFAFLNFNAMALGTLLLDDQLLLGRKAPPEALPPPAQPGIWSKLRGAAIGYNLVLTLVLFVVEMGVPLFDVDRLSRSSLLYQLLSHRVANSYHLYKFYEPVRRKVEFSGSIDGGKTWKKYEYRHSPNRLDEIGPWVSPYFPRLEGTISLAAYKPMGDQLFERVVAAMLTPGDELAKVLFQNDPFDGKTPDRVVAERWIYNFTDLETHRKTGKYWSRKYDGDYLPVFRREADGRILPER